MSDVDAVTLEVVRNGLLAVAEEMTATLVRTAHSPNVTERRDCSCAVFDASGRMVAQAETIPVHLGAMPFSVRAALEAFPPDELDPGDAVLSNDPYAGGAHLPDLTLVAPVFHDGAVVAYVANRAHHADVGGASAGSVSAAATEIYQEGLRVPPVKLRRAGEYDQAVLELLFANVRTPAERRGDLRAQVGAVETGRERALALLERHGAATFADALEAVQDYSERRMRDAVAALPDGRWSFADALEDDGQGATDLPVEATVTVAGEAVTVDFAGSAPQTAGPVNAPLAVTTSATYYALRAVTDPDIPPNRGCYRPVTVEAPAGTVVNAEPPAAVVGGNLETSQRVVDVVLGALAEAVPDRVPAAGQGTMNNLTLGGTDPRDGEPWAFYETHGGGAGGRAGADGMDGVHVHMSNTQNTPVEVLETAYPLRVRRYAFRPGSGGDGEFRGGLGLRRDVEARAPATASVLAERHRLEPYGLRGGEPGETGAAVLFPDGDEAAAERLAAKTTLDLAAGDVLSLRTPGGGGYGTPAARDGALRERDRRREKTGEE